MWSRLFSLYLPSFILIKCIKEMKEMKEIKEKVKRVEKKGKDNILGGEFVGELLLGNCYWGNIFTLVRNTKRKHKYFFI
ncbi:MAG: hypothetical protein QG646_934 [Euryarchaeota archaeon]|nr:hypothetical protein [Euryarchaeota archaeon]